MPKFLFIYHGGKIPESQEEGERVMAAWGAWYEKLGAAVVDPGAPVGKSHTVSDQGHVADGGSNPVSGYSIVEAADYATACGYAADNPMVVDGSGSCEVAEMVEMG